MTPEQTAALDVARALVAAGIPLFTAPPDPDSPTGFKLPRGWQLAQPDPRVVDAWRPGMALAMVCGHGLDLLDADPRAGGDPAEALRQALGGVVPVAYATAITPSGGVHSFIRSLGVRSRDGVVPGVDVKAGDDEGNGRGFAFIAPTVRRSKVTGEPAAYRWVSPPDLARLAAAGDDASGQALAELIRTTRAGGDAQTVDDFMRTGPWAELAAGTVFRRGRNHGVARLAQALRGRGGWRLEDAIEYMRATVWPHIDQTQNSHPFTVEEFEATIAAQWRQYPDGAEQRAAVAAAAPRTEPATAPGVIAHDPARFTQAHLAEEFVQAVLLGRFRWAQGLHWVAWDGRRWRRCAEEEVVEQARLWAKRMLAEAARALQKGHCDIKYVNAWHSVAKTAASLRAIVSLARGIDGVITDAATFDAHPDLLNVANGVVDLRTGKLRPHDPDLLLTKLAPVDYHPDASHPDWTAALTALPPEVIDWYQIRLGQSITGYMTPDDVMVIQQGGGENGKTTILAAVEKTLGDYAVLVSDKVILADPKAHTTERMELRGARFALIEETPEERRLSVSLLKKVLGTPTMTARYIARDEVRWEATHSLWPSTNYLPLVEEVDHGTWRRLLVLKFPYTYVTPPATPGHELERQADPTLRDRMRGNTDRQHEAVLAWLVRGAVAWYAAGKVLPPPPERVVQDTRQWRKDNDLILAYLDDRITFDPDRHVMSTDLLNDMNAWLIQHGHRAWSDKVFASRFGAHGEVVRHHVARRKQRRNDRLSRPVPTPPTAVPETYSAWLGVRFDADRNQPLNRADEDHVPGVPGVGGGSKEKSPRENLRLDPEHPERDLDASDGGRSNGKITASKPGVTERKRVALLEAAGPPVTLPALVDRTGAIRSLTVAEAGQVLAAAIQGSGALTVDVETTGYPVGHAHHELRTVQLGDEHTAVVLDAGDPAQADVARIALAAAPRLHAHSATADLVPLAAAGLVDVDAWQRMYDTVIPAKLADPASTGSDPGLKQLAGAVLGDQAVTPAADAARAALFKAGRWLTSAEATTPPERCGWAQVDPACTTMVRYAAADVLDTAALAARLPRLPAAVLERERAVQRITARVTHHGLRIDGAQVDALIAEHTAAREAAAARVRAFGIDNPGSDRQVAAALTALGAELPRTRPSQKHPDGQPSVAAAALERLRGTPGKGGELSAAVLDYRRHETVLSVFLEPYRQLVRSGDGRARPTIYTLGTDTGRMSCVRPNLQQLPRTGGVRACIAADPGYTLISADFSGVELRVAAALSGDPNLRRMIVEGVDLHWEIARQVWGPEATKADRYAAKRIVFGRLYGGGVPTLAAQAGVSEAVAASAVDVLDSMTPGLAAWSRYIREEIKRGNTKFSSYAGRIIHFPRDYPHKGPNYAIQGTARELLVDALLRWDATRWGGGVVLPVHDEIVAMVPEAEAQAATAALVACMTTELQGVPIVAEASVPAPAWQDSV